MTSPPPTGKRPSILIVDDDADLRGTLDRMLDPLGYAVECVADSVAAITAIQAHVPDLVLTDIYMPGGDGFELLNWLRMNDMAIPVVAMSGSNAGPGRYDQLGVAKHLGAVVVIDKPFRQSQLVETIDRVLAHRRASPRR